MSPAEVIARAAGHACCGDCPRADYDRVARLALAALDAAGLAVVPKEPTEEMLWAADLSMPPQGTQDHDPDADGFVLFGTTRAEWAAMLAAAKEGE